MVSNCHAMPLCTDNPKRQGLTIPVLSFKTIVMKIKELSPNTNLGGIKIKAPDGKIGYYVSQWIRGVFLSNDPHGNGRIFPVFVEDLKQVLEWEITEEEPNLE